jgi:hypothetical protein
MSQIASQKTCCRENADADHVRNNERCRAHGTELAFKMRLRRRQVGES